MISVKGGQLNASIIDYWSNSASTLELFSPAEPLPELSAYVLSFFVAPLSKTESTSLSATNRLIFKLYEVSRAT